MLQMGRPRASKLTVASTLLLAGCMLAVLGPTLSSGNDEDNFYNHMVPRVGYFSDYNPSGKFSKIYQEYFENVIRKNDGAMEKIGLDDWRKVRPTAELCDDFLSSFRAKSYVMSKPYELIMVDACLDWLFNNENKDKVDQRARDLQRLGRARAMAIKTLTDDKKLKAIYEGTMMKSENVLPESLLTEIYDYFVSLLHIYGKDPIHGCHSLWLEAYNDFVDKVYVRDCEDEANCLFFGIDRSQDDSYLNLIIESTKDAAKTCYSVMRGQIQSLVEQEYERSNSVASSIKKKYLSWGSRAERQSKSERWAQELLSILQLVSGVGQDTPINLGVVAEKLHKIKTEKDQELINSFTRALGDYAKGNANFKNSENDSSGRRRFGQAMIKLCGPYTNKNMFLSQTGGMNMDDQTDGPKPFEFYGLIYSLVRLTNHEQLFGLTKEQFEEDVISNKWEALYMATFTCQIISTVLGEITFEFNNGAGFKVLLRPEWEVMIAEWPIEVLNEKLPLKYPLSSESSRATVKEADQSGKPAIFGKKMKLNFRKFSSEDEFESDSQLAQQSEPQAQAPKPAPVPISEPPAHKAEPVSNSINSDSSQPPDQKTVSLETIQMWKKLKGRDMKDLTDVHFKKYPQLLNEVTSASQTDRQPAMKPSAELSFGRGGDFGGQYGSTSAFGGSRATGISFGSSYESDSLSNSGFGNSYGTGKSFNSGFGSSYRTDSSFSGGFGNSYRTESAYNGGFGNSYRSDSSFNSGFESSFATDNSAYRGSDNTGSPRRTGDSRGLGGFGRSGGLLSLNELRGAGGLGRNPQRFSQW